MVDWPARAVALLLVLDCRATREPSVTTDQLPPDRVQPSRFPSSKSSENRVAAKANGTTVSVSTTMPSNARTTLQARKERAGRRPPSTGAGPEAEAPIPNTSLGRGGRLDQASYTKYTHSTPRGPLRKDGR